MATVPLTLNVDPETAEAYAAASAEERKKIEVLLTLRLKDLVGPGQPRLRDLMDQMGRVARARGLTPEILDEILADEESDG